MKTTLLFLCLIFPLLGWSQIKKGSKPLVLVSHYQRIGDGSTPGPLKKEEEPTMVSVSPTSLILSYPQEENTVYQIKSMEVKGDELYIHLGGKGLGIWNKHKHMFGLYIPEEKANLILEQVEEGS